ncbi:amidohydrolase [Candidatus Bathyarchaeota archaeon]|nr:amidohydrolase [Candidatus Bathyarchaeota archaeon]
MLAIKGGKFLTITKGIIDGGVILIDNGKIKAIGPDLKIPDNAKVINANRKIVMPGLIDAHCHIGISEELAGQAGADYNEAVDPITPQMKASDGIKANADEMGLTAAVKTGITTVQVLPGSANVLGGVGCVIKTAPKVVVTDMIIKEPSGMKAAFGENPRRVYGDQKKTPQTRMGVAAILREWLERTKIYMNKKERAGDDTTKLPEYNPKLEALIPLLKGEIPMRAHAHRADDIAMAIRICGEYGLKMSWEHATEGHRIAEYIAKRGISATFGPAMMGRGKWEMRELNIATAVKLYEAGVKFAIQTDATSSTIQYLPIVAGLAHREGLPYEEALKVITINPAEILGVNDRVGSLEKGKDADIRILSGDPLELKTKVEKVILNGELVYSR